MGVLVDKNALPGVLVDRCVGVLVERYTSPGVLVDGCVGVLVTRMHYQVCWWTGVLVYWWKGIHHQVS